MTTRAVREAGNASVEVTQLIADYFLRDESGVHESARLVEDLGADSLEILEITFALNERFGIELPEDNLAQVRTVADLIREVRQLI